MSTMIGVTATPVGGGRLHKRHRVGSARSLRESIDLKGRGIFLRKLIGSLHVALAGLAALLGFEYAMLRLQPLTAVSAFSLLAAYSLIVCGIVKGLTRGQKQTPEDRRKENEEKTGVLMLLFGICGKAREKKMTKSETKAGEDRLLDRAYHLTGGDTHKPVDLQGAWRELGLTLEQMRRLLCSLVEQGYLLASDEPASSGAGHMALFLTSKAVKKMANIETRQ